MIKNRLFQEYSEIIVGRRDSFSASLFSPQKPTISEKNALNVFSYAIEDFLKLSPMEAKSKLNKLLIKKMHLDLVIDYIKFPTEFSPDTDFEYILSRLYPDEIILDKEEYVSRYYRRLLDNGKQFAFGYFSGNDGKEKLCICLRYFLTHYTTFESIDELYGRFAGFHGDSLKKTLANYKLAHPCYDLYQYRVTFLHDALPEEQKDDYLWHYYLYVSMRRKYMKENGLKLNKIYAIDVIPEGL